MNISSWRNI